MCMPSLGWKSSNLQVTSAILPAQKKTAAPESLLRIISRDQPAPSTRIFPHSATKSYPVPPSRPLNSSRYQAHRSSPPETLFHLTSSSTSSPPGTSTPNTPCFHPNQSQTINNVPLPRIHSQMRPHRNGLPAILPPGPDHPAEVPAQQSGADTGDC